MKGKQINNKKSDKKKVSKNFQVNFYLYLRIGPYQKQKKFLKNQIKVKLLIFNKIKTMKSKIQVKLT